MPALNDLATKAYDAQSTFADRVHIVHIYVIEPHPKAPDVGPYSGAVSEAGYSTKRQPISYEERAANARETAAPLQGRQLMLVDELAGTGSNPIWCTYGTCPNCAFLIRRDGTIDTVQTWLDVPAMERAIRVLVGA